MLNQLESLKKQVGGSNTLVDNWLTIRKQLLVTYYNVVGIKPGKASLAMLNEKTLDNFCQNLVDYLSAGHFNIYERLVNEMEGSSPYIAAHQLYPLLEENTQQLMSQYDTWLEHAIDNGNCAELQQALSQIGEALEARFMLEDKLIVLAFNNDLRDASNTPDSLARPA